MTQNGSTAIVPLDNYEATILESIVVQGNIAALTPEQRMDYYTMRCEAAGLDPRTQPFAYLQLQGKLTLYATKTATEQLCEKRCISTEITAREMLQGDIWSVTCRARKANGQCTDATGAVTVAGLKGDNLANAYMKAETKAKRRAVLALCGLGMLDETETETIPNAQIVPVEAPAPALVFNVCTREQREEIAALADGLWGDEWKESLKQHHAKSMRETTKSEAMGVISKLKEFKANRENIEAENAALAAADADVVEGDVSEVETRPRKEALPKSSDIQREHAKATAAALSAGYDEQDDSDPFDDVVAPVGGSNHDYLTSNK